MKLTSAELVKKIAQNSRFSVDDTALFMETFRFSVIDSLQKEGDVVYVKGIGKFFLKLRKGKYDTLSGARRKTKDKLAIVFEPSEGLATWDIGNTD